MDPYAVPNADIVITRDQVSILLFEIWKPCRNFGWQIVDARLPVPFCQICPPSGPNAVVASVHHDKGCVYVGYPEPSWGVSSYVNGGSPYRRSAVPDTLVPAASQLEKRSDCTLDVESQVDTYSTSVIISETVDCRGKVSRKFLQRPFFLIVDRRLIASLFRSSSADFRLLYHYWKATY